MDLDNNTKDVTNSEDKPLINVNKSFSENVQNVANKVGVFLRNYIKNNKLASSIIGAVILVVLIFLILLIVHSSGNPLDSMVKSISKDIDSGSFNFDIEVDINEKPSMKYTGGIIFNQGEGCINAAYDAKYPDYEYKSVLYTNNTEATSGNFYNGKWTITDSTAKVRDFFDFYLDFRKGKFDGGAFLSFFDKTGTFSPTELGRSIDKVFSDLKGQTNNILHMSITSKDGVTTYTMKPELKKLFDLIVKDSGPAFMSATEYLKFTESVENNEVALTSANCTIEYKIQSGNMVGFSLSLKSGQKTQTINMKMSDFGNAKVEIPQTFFDAASIDFEG